MVDKDEEKEKEEREKKERIAKYYEDVARLAKEDKERNK